MTAHRTPSLVRDSAPLGLSLGRAAPPEGV